MDSLFSVIYKEICIGIDRTNKEIEKYGAFVGRPHYLEIIPIKKEKENGKISE